MYLRDVQNRSASFTKYFCKLSFAADSNEVALTKLCLRERCRDVSLFRWIALDRQSSKDHCHLEVAPVGADAAGIDHLCLCDLAARCEDG